MELYTKEDFARQDIILQFNRGNGSLSIIDVCMHTPLEEIQQTLRNYTLI